MCPKGNSNRRASVTTWMNSIDHRRAERKTGESSSQPAPRSIFHGEFVLRMLEHGMGHQEKGGGGGGGGAFFLVPSWAPRKIKAGLDKRDPRRVIRLVISPSKSSSLSSGDS